MSNLTATNGNTVTLYAVWEADSTITYQINGAASSIENQIYHFGDTTALASAPDVNGSGFTFRGWTATAKDGTVWTVGEEYDDGTISPNNNITRAEVAMIFYRMLKNQNVTVTAGFPDVPDSGWYAVAVRTLASLNIIRGYDDGRFYPNKQITRQEFAAIATRFAKATGGKSTFTDVAANSWAYDNIATASDYGWVTGYNGMFRPTDNITRAEVATIVNHMLGRAADEAYVKANAAALKQFSDLQDSSKWYYLDMVEASNEHHFTRDADGTEKWTK